MVSRRGLGAALEELVEELAVGIFLGRYGAFDSCLDSASVNVSGGKYHQGRNHGHAHRWCNATFEE